MRYTLHFALMAAVLGVFAVNTASAAEYEVIQKDKLFSEETKDLKVGDTIKFTNSDDVTHNIYSKSEVKDFEVAKQDPGTSEIVTFDKAGEVKVRCAIHPKMKLTVNVTE